MCGHAECEHSLGPGSHCTVCDREMVIKRQNAERVPMVKGRPLAERLEMRRANTRNFRKNNPDGQLRLELLKYGVTVEWYRAKEWEQQSLCAVCAQFAGILRPRCVMERLGDWLLTTIMKLERLED